MELFNRYFNVLMTDITQGQGDGINAKSDSRDVMAIALVALAIHDLTDVIAKGIQDQRDLANKLMAQSGATDQLLNLLKENRGETPGPSPGTGK